MDAVQALDHAAGFIMAACAVRGLTARGETGRGSIWRTSLARVAEFLAAMPADSLDGSLSAPGPADFAGGAEEQTGWGPGRRLPPPLRIDGASMRWDRPAGPLGTAPAAW